MKFNIVRTRDSAILRTINAPNRHKALAFAVEKYDFSVTVCQPNKTSGLGTTRQITKSASLHR